MKLIPMTRSRDCLSFLENLRFKCEGTMVHWLPPDGFTVSPLNFSIVNGESRLELKYYFFDVATRDKYFILWDVECVWPDAKVGEPK